MIIANGWISIELLILIETRKFSGSLQCSVQLLSWGILPSKHLLEAAPWLHLPKCYPT